MSGKMTLKKNKKPLKTTLGKAPSHVEKPVDLSHIQKPINTSIFGLREVLSLFETATNEVKGYVTKECDIMYECKVCRTIFRSLANFVLHKRNYCQESYTPLNTINKNEFEEDNFVGDVDEVSISEDKISENSDTKEKKSMSSVLQKLLQKREQDKEIQEIVNKDLSKEPFKESNIEKKDSVALEPIGTTDAAVFQTVFKDLCKEKEKTNFMRTEVMELHGIFDNDEAVIGPDGKVLAFESDKRNIKQYIPKNNLMCTICKQKFSSKKTLTYHIKYKHNNSRLVYPCPLCSDILANAWGVSRHLLKVHRKTTVQIRKMRDHIHSSAYRRGQEPSHKRCSSISDDKNKMDSENQWIENIEGDNDLQMCGGCGRRFERKAALHSHSQMCLKRIALCNTIKENNLKQAQDVKNETKQLKGGKLSKSGADLFYKGSEKRKPLIIRRKCENTNATMKNILSNNKKITDGLINDKIDFSVKSADQSCSNSDTNSKVTTVCTEDKDSSHTKDDSDGIVPLDLELTDVFDIIGIPSVATNTSQKTIEDKENQCGTKTLEEISEEANNENKQNVVEVTNTLSSATIRDTSENNNDCTVQNNIPVESEQSEILTDLKENIKNTEKSEFLENLNYKCEDIEKGKTNSFDITEKAGYSGVASEMQKCLNINEQQTTANMESNVIPVSCYVKEDTAEIERQRNSQESWEIISYNQDTNKIVENELTINNKNQRQNTEENKEIISEKITMENVDVANVNIITERGTDNNRETADVENNIMCVINQCNTTKDTKEHLQNTLKLEDMDVPDNSENLESGDGKHFKSILKQCRNLNTYKRKRDSENTPDENTDTKKPAISVNNNKLTLYEKALNYIDEKTFSCLQCKVMHSSIDKLMKHMSEHFNWFCYQCRRCPYMSYDKETCINHIYTEHAIQNVVDDYILPVPNWKTNELSTDFQELKFFDLQQDKNEDSSNSKTVDAMEIGYNSVEKDVLQINEEKLDNSDCEIKENMKNLKEEKSYKDEANETVNMREEEMADIKIEDNQLQDLRVKEESASPKSAAKNVNYENVVLKTENTFELNESVGLTSNTECVGPEDITLKTENSSEIKEEARLLTSETENVSSEPKNLKDENTCEIKQSVLLTSDSEHMSSENRNIKAGNTSDIKDDLVLLTSETENVNTDKKSEGTSAIKCFSENKVIENTFAIQPFSDQETGNTKNQETENISAIQDYSKNEIESTSCCNSNKEIKSTMYNEMSPNTKNLKRNIEGEHSYCVSKPEHMSWLDEGSSVLNMANMENPTVRKMVMEVIFGNDDNPVKSSNEMDVPNKYDHTSGNVRSNKNDRPIRNRTKLIQNDYCYDMKQIVKNAGKVAFISKLKKPKDEDERSSVSACVSGEVPQKDLSCSNNTNSFGSGETTNRLVLKSAIFPEVPAVNTDVLNQIPPTKTKENQLSVKYTKPLKVYSRKPKTSDESCLEKKTTKCLKKQNCES